ncbi:MAG TPA: ABC transporter ATP-binding protein [Puia sp.]|uniref:ABC transporter ATP-binding protein n=1 Tax=Puia sp. TaxID=2045100 RepID=UPI002C025150|nr:ABC transporter ATP-binding protein [Puia sp.]HVU97091.1 ABC transporter ATP-binding protein [Puia sp.]
MLVIADVICEIVQPEMMSKIVDVGIRQKDLSYIIRTGGLMVGLSLLAILANVGNIWYSSQGSVGFVTGLRKGLFTKIQEFSFANIDRFSSASLVTRLTNDVNILQQVLMMSLRLLIRGPLMLIFAVVIAVRIAPDLALIIAIAIPVLGISIFFLLRRGIPFFIQMQDKLDKVNGAVQENLTNIRVIKSFAREGFEKKKFAVSNEDLMAISIKASSIVALIMPVMQLVMNVSIVAIVWFGGNKIMGGRLQVGQLMSFISYVTQILMSLMMLSVSVMTFSRAGASSRRILEVLDTTPDIMDSPLAIREGRKPGRGKVEFIDVSFKYHSSGEEYVLKDIRLTVEAGERVAIVGATGSAKSTLVQLIPRLYDVTEGQVLVDGVDVRNYTLFNLRDKVGMVLQQNELFSGTIRDNLKWGNPAATEEELVAAAQAAQAHDFILSFPEQYDTILGQGGVNVSGGQKQRLCLARALLRKPVILILDDSTSSVDTATESRIREALRREFSHTTTFIIAQRIGSIMSADKIVLLDEGAIIAKGSHEELMGTSRAYREIYYSQKEKEDSPV